MKPLSLLLLNVNTRKLSTFLASYIFFAKRLSIPAFQIVFYFLLQSQTGSQNLETSYLLPCNLVTQWLLINWRNYNPYVRPSEITFGPTKGRKLRNVITYVIWANQNTESFVYSCLCAHALFDVTCFPTFVRAQDVISSVLLIR